MSPRSSSMDRYFVFFLLVATATLAALLGACGRESGVTGGGQSISETRRDVFGAEGIFQRGQNAAKVEEIAAQNKLEWRKVEVKEFLGGTLNRVVVTDQPGQLFFAYVFLPLKAGGRGETVILERAKDQVVAVLAWECFIIKDFLSNGGVSGFANDYCS